MFLMLMKETEPFRFFASIASGFFAAGVGLMVPVFIEYFTTGLVLKMPTWVLAMSLVMLSMLMMVAGVVLDSVSRGRVEHKRMAYLTIPSLRGETRKLKRLDRAMVA